MSQESKPKPLVVEPDGGRTYPMGRMSAVFKADLDETNSTLSASEWWMDPNTEGPPLHSHPEDHLFYVLEGPMAVYLETKGWFEVDKGSYVYIPGDTEHGFENRSEGRVGLMAITTPGGFEATVPHIVGYFEEHPLGDALNES